MLCICIIGELINKLDKKLINELKIDILRAKLELNFNFFVNRINEPSSSQLVFVRANSYRALSSSSSLYIK